MAKLNKFAQLYKQKVIYIYETPLAMDELSNYFDPKTVWVDVTDMPNVEVGYIQGVDESGNFVLKSPTSVSQEENYMTPDENYYTIYYNIKLQRERDFSSKRHCWDTNRENEIWKTRDTKSCVVKQQK